MKLIIMRHGEAEALHVEDIQRNLTTVGQQQALKAGKWLTDYLGVGEDIDLALVSHFARAEQTFNQVGQQILISDKQTSVDVIPTGNPKLTQDFIDLLIHQNPSLEVVLIVSHMPFVSYFLEQVNSRKETMLFDTSSLVVVNYNPANHSGEIEAIYHPN